MNKDNKKYIDYIFDSKLLDNINRSTWSISFWKNIFKNKDSLISNIDIYFEYLSNSKYEISNKWDIVKDIMDKDIPDNVFYWYLVDNKFCNIKEYNKLSYYVKDDVDSNLKDFSSIVELITRLNSSAFKYIWEPIFISNLSKSIWYDINSTNWKRIKFFNLFYQTKSYDEYSNLYEFFQKIESFKSWNVWEEFKIWWFWFVTLPFFILFFALFLPLWVFISFLMILAAILYKVLKSFHSKTSYKVNFNFWFNLLAWFSMIIFFVSSIFVTNFDAYKSSYERFQYFINLMSAVNTIDFFDNISTKSDILSWIPNDNEFDLIDRMSYNYIKTNKSFYNYSYNASIQGKKEELDELHWSAKDEQIEKFYFESDERYLNDWVYIWNLLDIIYTKYKFEDWLSLNSQDKYFLFKDIIRDYVNLNIQYFRSKSIHNNPAELTVFNISNYLPKDFKVNMYELEKLFKSNLSKYK